MAVNFATPLPYQATASYELGRHIAQSSISLGQGLLREQFVEFASVHKNEEGKLQHQPTDRLWKYKAPGQRLMAEQILPQFVNFLRGVEIDL
jgi:hypothetical protein